MDLTGDPSDFLGSLRLFLAVFIPTYVSLCLWSGWRRRRDAKRTP